MLKKNLFFCCLLTISLSLFQACVSDPAIHNEQTGIILERMACFGACPAYKLTLLSSGKITYEGYNFVDIQGKRTTEIDPIQIQDLIYEFGKINFFSLEDNYAAEATDIPSFAITLKIGNRQKRVEHFTCPPQGLVDLEYKIDEITNSKQWVGSNAYQQDRKPDCAALYPNQPASPLK